MNRLFNRHLTDFETPVMVVMHNALHNVFTGYNDKSRIVSVDYEELIINNPLGGQYNIVLKEMGVQWGNVMYYVSVGYDYQTDTLYVLKNSAYRG